MADYLINDHSWDKLENTQGDKVHLHCTKCGMTILLPPDKVKELGVEKILGDLPKCVGVLVQYNKEKIKKTKRRGCCGQNR